MRYRLRSTAVAVVLAGFDGVLFSNKAAWKRVGGCRCSSGKASRARPAACAASGVDCVAGEAVAGAVVGGAAVFADERKDVCINRAVAASACDPVVFTGCEGR